MQTAAGTVWKGIPTPLDNLFFPSIEMAGGFWNRANFLVRDKQPFVVSFGNVESICAYEETPYWTFAEESSRPGHALNLIVGTELLARIEAMYSGSRYFHFLLCGGDLCAEVLAQGYAIKRFDCEADAEQALARELGHRITDAGLGISDWQVPADT